MNIVHECNVAEKVVFLLVLEYLLAMGSSALVDFDQVAEVVHEGAGESVSQI
jgi:hypothetical protein